MKLTDTQAENLVAVATIVVVGAAAVTVGKLCSAVSGRLMTRKFDAAVDALARSKKN